MIFCRLPPERFAFVFDCDPVEVLALVLPLAFADFGFLFAGELALFDWVLAFLRDYHRTSGDGNQQGQ